MADLVVVSFNLRNGRALDGRNSWPLRRRSAAQVLRDLDADVIALQEVYRFQQRYLERALRDHAAHGDGRSARGTGERCPLLLRRSRLDVLARRTRWYGADGARGSRLPGASFPRVATWARLRDRTAGFEFDVFNTHLDERHADNRRRSADQLAGWVMPGQPTVVVGDFNATESDELFVTLREAGLGTALPSDAGGTAHGFSGRADGRRIDHILVSAHFEVRRAAVISDVAGRLPSDHWPVVVALQHRL